MTARKRYGWIHKASIANRHAFIAQSWSWDGSYYLLSSCQQYYILFLIVSFAGTPRITYNDVPIRFNLWRVCDTSSDVCNQWADSVYSSSIVNSTFSGSKPSKTLLSSGTDTSKFTRKSNYFNKATVMFESTDIKLE